MVSSLKEALGLREGDVVALVGAGGKTTAAMRLLREVEDDEACRGGVIFTTTTRFLEPIPQSHEALLLATSERELEALPRLLASHRGVFLARRRLEEEDSTPLGGPFAFRRRKLEGIPPSWIDSLAPRWRRVTVLVEADGARHRLLKAPAAHEPVVPASASLFIPLADLAVLGCPLHDEHVHRPELAASLLGVPLGSQVTPEMVARLLSHPEGGLKGSPPWARIVPILHQREGGEPSPRAQRVASLLLRNPRIRRVVIASLRRSPPVLAVMEEAPGGLPRGLAAAIVLAAGASQRFGCPKQLLPWGGKPLLQHVVDEALASPVGQVIVVLGHRAGELAPCLAGRPVRLVVNEEWERGISSSVREGLLALEPGTEAAIFLLADQPLVTRRVIAALLRRWRETRALIVAPFHKGRRGNPVLFSRPLFPQLLSLKGEGGGRALISRYEEEVERVEAGEGVLLDIDTPEDYRALCESMGFA